MTFPLTRILAAGLVTSALILACGGDEDRRRPSDDASGATGAGLPPRGYENAGQECAAPGDCYPDIDHADLAGAVQCMDRVENGYCTHNCGTDSDCCAVDGECDTDLAQVCAPFESTNQYYCLLSCEDADVAAGQRLAANDDYTPPPGSDDATEFCRRWAGIEFGCRSTGGGRDNRKVCMPIGGNCNNFVAQDDACKSCLVGDCCGEAAACDADASCGLLVDCRRGCDTPSCLEDCDAQYPGAASVYRSFYYCMTSACPLDCKYDTL